MGTAGQPRRDRLKSKSAAVTTVSVLTHSASLSSPNSAMPAKYSSSLIGVVRTFRMFRVHVSSLTPRAIENWALGEHPEHRYSRQQVRRAGPCCRRLSRHEHSERAPKQHIHGGPEGDLEPTVRRTSEDHQVTVHDRPDAGTGDGEVAHGRTPAEMCGPGPVVLERSATSRNAPSRSSVPNCAATPEGVPSAAIRPRAMITTRSHNVSTSRML